VSSRILSTSVGTNQETFSPLDWTLFVSIGLIWGSSFLLIDIGLEAFKPALVTWMRIGLGALVLSLVPKARRRIEPYDVPRLIALSFVWVAIPFTLFPIAQQYINSAVAGMLNGAMPIFAAIITTLLLRRLPHGAVLIGLILGFVGLASISLASGAEGSSETLGVVLVLLATACYGLAVNIAAPITQKYGALAVNARMLAYATIWTAPLGVTGLLHSTFAWDSLFALVALGAIGTGLAFVIMGSLVSRVGSTRSSFITYMLPVVALVLGVLFRNDRVTVVSLIGVALVIGGALLAARRETKSSSRQPDSHTDRGTVISTREGG
jgi:drug/metabolite transporter (DMT)-like permease